ncbi:MAG: imidazoleglycerol-phosphate dehydratase HisB [Intestinibaculum porci]|uniref:imidazoleglycerol-phosphate dehydratase HisB n=1 Tax=Intestinibaculum porci TaxID=2487118 RepID=UPI003F12550E
MRQATISRHTKETKITCELNLDGTGKADVQTGIGFLDHMLTLLSFHSRFDLKVHCDGDLEVDSHHSVEDIGIALGDCLTQALGEKRGIVRYGSFTIPMDEALVTVDLDLSGRPYLVYHATLNTPVLGNYETEMTEEFFRALSDHAKMTLHINEHYGKNTHHIIEAMFKATGRALKQAVAIDEKYKDEISSSKGVL